MIKVTIYNFTTYYNRKWL